MTNSRASRGMILLDHHLATGTEATYTFTKTLDMKNKYREIYIIITGKATAAFTLQMKISAATNYDSTFIRNDTTTVSGIVTIDATELTLLGSGQIDGAVSFFGRVSLFLNDADDKIYALSEIGAPHEGQTHTFFANETSATTITSIETKTSTSTWIAGTEITIYGIVR